LIRLAPPRSRPYDPRRMHEKILPFATCKRGLEEVRRKGRKIVHCHGTFDLLHPGHLKHLEAAKKHGDVLVVTITSAPS